MFSLASTSTVQFAKDYRAEQIRTADQSRTAESFRGPEHRLFRSAIATIAARFDQRDSTRQTVLSKTVGA